MKSFFFFLFIFSLLLHAKTDSIPQPINSINGKVNLSDTLFNAVNISDTLKPLYQEPLFNNSDYISNEKIHFSNYRYFGEILLQNPTTFIRDYGFIGYPNTLKLFGTKLNSVSILKDGIQLNNRYLNIFNLNLIQTEEIDSVEIIPLVRGFLYSSLLNSATINIITKDYLSTIPYSRIKYYQGPDRESFINGYFNAKILKRLFFTFSVSNRIKDATYLNSDFSIWQGNFKLKYLISNKINLVASFNVDDYKLGFNGGVDYDSVLKLTSKTDDLLYDQIAAPTVFPAGKIKTLRHFPMIVIKSNLWKWLNSNITFFYLNDDTEFLIKKNKPYFYKDKVWGSRFINKINFKKFEFGTIFDFEKISNNNLSEKNFLPGVHFQTSFKSNLISFGGYISLINIIKNCNISFYKKLSHQSQNILESIIEKNKPITYFASKKNIVNSSIGIDINSKLTDQITAYFGYSIINNQDEVKKSNNFLLESSIKYNNQFLSLTLRYFINELYESSSYYLYFFRNINNYNSNGIIYGSSYQLQFKYDFLLFESIGNHYWKKHYKQPYHIPSYFSRNGIFYADILFNNNLDFKGGLTVNLIGNQITVSEFTKSPYIITIAPIQTIDLQLIGTIQKTATLYFIWENLLNKRYFLVPFFPMPERNIRFGVSWKFLN